MGRKGRELVKLNLKDLIEDLRGAMALEWRAAYYFWYCSQVAEGLNSPPVSEFFKKQVGEEIGHAEELSERIQQLGGEPIGSPEDWVKYGKSIQPVRDHSDLAGMIKKALQVEADAITLYDKLVNATRLKDVVTHELAEDLLKSEVAEEEEFENLLGSLLKVKGPKV